MFHSCSQRQGPIAHSQQRLYNTLCRSSSRSAAAPSSRSCHAASVQCSGLQVRQLQQLNPSSGCGKRPALQCNAKRSKRTVEAEVTPVVANDTQVCHITSTHPLTHPHTHSTPAARIPALPSTREGVGHHLSHDSIRTTRFLEYWCCKCWTIAVKAGVNQRKERYLYPCLPRSTYIMSLMPKASMCTQEESRAEDAIAGESIAEETVGVLTAETTTRELEPREARVQETHVVVQPTGYEVPRQQQIWQMGVAGIVGLAAVGGLVIMGRKLLSTQLPKVQKVCGPSVKKLVKRQWRRS